MTYMATFEQLKAYFELRVLDEVEEEIDEYTPLLDWGFINSLEIARLVAFINETFMIDIPAEKMAPTMFQNLHTITNLVIGQI
jgi:acyl carrier protein